MRYYAGIDAGSTYIKVAVLDETGKMLGRDHRPTGIDADQSAREMLDSLINQNRINGAGMENIIATGYSRRGISSAHETVTEIKAHAQGAAWSANGGPPVRTVIDIGGQDSKVIVIGDNGVIENFVMNDKCAAGTGRFLEVMARALEVDLDAFGEMSLQADEPAKISSLCTVFAESEVISLIAKGARRANIIAGIHASIGARVVAMANRLKLQAPVMMTGGVAHNIGVVKALEDKLGLPVQVSAHAQVNGAIGAARLAAGG